jgi:peptide/nickel transport system substrate-binding protein
MKTARRKAVLLTVLAAIPATAATRPHYGGTLRVEVREANSTPDPPPSGHRTADLAGAFTITTWEGGRHAVYSADENATGGRPFVDTVEIQMARALRDQSIDLELGKADIVELGPNDLRRQPAGRKVWSSAPARVVALVFGARVEDARIREALALAVDRSAIHTVLLQRQGEISGALLPQWLSGYAFLFSTAADIAKARALTAGMPVASRTLSLSVPDASMRTIADRIALNARDAGLTVSVAVQNANADVRLVEARIGSADAARALAGLAASLGLPEPSRTDSPEALFAAERALLEGFRVIPLLHLPDTYGVNPRVKGGPGITPLGEWRFENLWLESGRP